MAKNGKIKKLRFHYQGFNALRKDPALTADLTARGERIAAAAGGEPEIVVITGASKTRSRVVVATGTPAAMNDEATNRTLTRALDAGRG